MLNLRSLFIVTAALTIFATSCKKDKATGQSITGRYRVVYNSGSNSLPQYYLFNDDNSFDKLEQTNQQAHTIVHGIYTVDGTTMTLSVNAPYTYLIVQNGDTLKILGNPLAPETNFPNVVLVREASAPSAQDWVAEVDITHIIPAVNINVSSFTVRNTMFYTGYSYENKIRRYNTNDGAEQSALVTLTNYAAVEAAGGTLWGVSDNSDVLRKLDPATGLVTLSAPAAPVDIHSLASDGTKVYCYSINDNKIYTYTIATNSYDAGRSLDADIREMAFYNGFLYGSNYQYIYKIDPVTLTVVKSYSVKGPAGPDGIAHDGTDFWVYINDQLATPGFFGRINLN